MKKITPLQLIYTLEYETDARRIVRICATNDIEVSVSDAYRIWKDYSEGQAGIVNYSMWKGNKL